VQEGEETVLNFRNGVDDKKTKVSGDEFVPAAAGVELPAERAEFFDESLFDEMMDVFGVSAGGVDPRRIGFGAGRNFFEGGESLVNFSGGEDADGFKSFGPRAVDGDFVREEAAVKGEGALEGVEVGVGCAIEAAAPEAVVFARGGGGGRGVSRFCGALGLGGAFGH
jgi:hypothetical protein